MIFDEEYLKNECYLCENDREIFRPNLEYLQFKIIKSNNLSNK